MTCARQIHCPKSRIQMKFIASFLLVVLVWLTPVIGQERIAPTRTDVRYGPYERNVLDFWQARSDRPTPLVVSIHGGGFTKGNKSISPETLKLCLENGISVAAISYRYSTQAIAPAPFHDAARAVQFLRFKAAEWNLDKTHFGATGGSAGAGISLWLGFHDDLADKENNDPVLRESSRIQCMAVFNAQSSYDPRVVMKMFPNASRPPAEGALNHLFGLQEGADYTQSPAEKIRLFEEFSPINHVTEDDAPVLVTYRLKMESPPDIHHPLFGKLLKEKMDAMGLPCEVRTDIKSMAPAQALAFFLRYLKP